MVDPTNERYYTDASGTTDPPSVFDYGAYLDFLQNRHHNFIPLGVFEQVQGTPGVNEIWFTPSFYQRTGSGSAQDGQPKFDLTKFNQAYFDRLRSRIIDAGSRDIYVSVMFFNGFSVGKKSSNDPGNPWPGHPFNANNNINGINGDPDNDGKSDHC